MLTDYEHLLENQIPVILRIKAATGTTFVN